jgi:hypothetical protein
MATVSETREIAPFDGIELKGTGTLHVAQDPQVSLRIEADEDTLDKIVTEVEGNRLVIRFRWLDALLAFRPLGPVDIYVSTPELRVVKIAGSGRLEGVTPVTTDRLYLSVTGSGKVVLHVDTPDLHASVSGSGDFDLSGRAARQEISISGAGDYLASGLATESTDIQITGSGRAQLQASERLDITISGSGRIEYAGAATVSQRVSGSGTVVRLAESAQPALAEDPAAGSDA